MVVLLGVEGVGFSGTSFCSEGRFYYFCYEVIDNHLDICVDSLLLDIKQLKFR